MPPAPQLASIVHKNIRTLVEMRREAERLRSRRDRLADQVARFIGSFRFIVAHSVFFVAWGLVNSGFVGIKPFDPFPFTLIGTLASIEAIFLTTFVLISQNRLSRLENERSDLDLQVNLLTEHELTHLVTLVETVADHLGVSHGMGEKLQELKTEVSPERVLAEMEKAEGEKPVEG